VERIKARVKWFDEKKGYGFLIEPGEPKEIFVHYTAIQSEGFKTLKESEEVEFEPEFTDKGKRAAKVWRKGE
jgi:CspA family cold shock protein